jgi:hypothetical protein
MRHPVCCDASQMGFCYRDKVIKAFSAECADHAFAEALLASDLDTEPRRNRLIEQGENATMIMNEKGT